MPGLVLLERTGFSSPPPLFFLFGFSFFWFFAARPSGEMIGEGIAAANQQVRRLEPLIFPPSFLFFFAAPPAPRYRHGLDRFGEVSRIRNCFLSFFFPFFSFFFGASNGVEIGEITGTWCAGCASSFPFFFFPGSLRGRLSRKTAR